MNRRINCMVALEYEYEIGPEKKIHLGTTSATCSTNIEPGIILTKDEEIVNCRGNRGIRCRIYILNRICYPIEVYLCDRLPCNFCYCKGSYKINGNCQSIRNAFDVYRVGIIQPYERFDISYVLADKYCDCLSLQQIPPANVMYHIINCTNSPNHWSCIESTSLCCMSDI